MKINRRQFTLSAGLGSVAALANVPPSASAITPQLPAVSLLPGRSGEDVFKYLNRVDSRFDEGRYRKIIGAANPFKEGDASLGVSADNNAVRTTAQQLLSNTRLSDLDQHPISRDRLSLLLQQTVVRDDHRSQQTQTLGQLKQWLLEVDETEIKARLPGLSSLAIGCVVKLSVTERVQA